VDDRAVVWVAEGTWPACIDAARAWVPEGSEIVLLYVAGGEIAAMHGAWAGLLGRGRRAPDPERDVDALSAAAAAELLEGAAQRDRPLPSTGRDGSSARSSTRRTGPRC
jgi:hypothetical protein